MNDPVSIPQSWLLAAAGAVVTSLGSLFVYFRAKVDGLDERMSTFVTRAELVAAEQRMEARAIAAEVRAMTMHTENSNNFRELRLQLESANTKLFELAKKE